MHLCWSADELEIPRVSLTCPVIPLLPLCDRYLPPGMSEIAQLNPTAVKAVLVGVNDVPNPAYMSRYDFRISPLDDAELLFSGVRRVVVCSRQLNSLRCIRC
jgi:hypothetical protein